LFINEFINKPRVAEVYNIGGGRDNSISVLEAFKLIESISGKESVYEYVDQNRMGDHMCYISDLSKMMEHYPNWSIKKDIKTTFQEIYDSWNKRLQ
jgi:CDP-paratose 2-epimerase